MAEDDETGTSSTSWCLLLRPDADNTATVETVMFARDERGTGSLDAGAADLLGIHGERVRCFCLPGFEKKMGISLHMYIDLQGIEHGLPHNTNATQLYLISHLPEEPPEVFPSSIHGPVLLSAENFKTEEYKDLGLEDWAKIKSLCKAVQPNAIFYPYEARETEDAEREEEEDGPGED